MKCKWCSESCVKAGKQLNGKQKYVCKSCRKYQQASYSYRAYDPVIHELFRRFYCMGSGVKRTSSFLEISINTLQKWISRALVLTCRDVFPSGCRYNIDELQTYTGKRSGRCWVTYGWNVELRKPVGLNVGGRSTEDLLPVIKEVLDCRPGSVSTDNYSVYKNEIPEGIHRRGKRKANHIERQHRNLRKNVACLIRETMCFAKKREMLEARLKWYFWGETDPYFFLRR